ncbi:MAG: glycosyltransferase family 2 protein [Spirochaetia bacterium]|nr:glycosyltransferase family 2 protein [Spirochaetia bacterium]
MSAKKSSAVLLSASIITFNEEARVHDCIASVHDFCDEVLVLDSFSTDKTEKIARKFPKVRFYKHAFDGHVQQKNRAFEMCKGQWIFSLDADERCTPELARSIADFLRNSSGSGPDGMRINRLTIHMGRPIKHGGWYNARYRLIRKGAASWGGENPHDQIFLHNQPRWKTNLGPALTGDLIHYSFKDLSDQINTINKFSSIIAFTRAGKGKKFSLVRLLWKPFQKFIEIYLLKAGFLDGMPGFVIAYSSAFSYFLREAKVFELQNGLDRPSNLRSDYQVQK